jgi:hypothetical protein
MRCEFAASDDTVSRGEEEKKPIKQISFLRTFVDSTVKQFIAFFFVFVNYSTGRGDERRAASLLSHSARSRVACKSPAITSLTECDNVLHCTEAFSLSSSCRYQLAT